MNLQNIAKETGVKREELRGYRIDKSEKPVFTEFGGYKAILNAVRGAGIDDVFVKGNRELVDDIAEILTKEKDVEKRYESLIHLGIDPNCANVKKLQALRNIIHILKAIELILEDLKQ